MIKKEFIREVKNKSVTYQASLLVQINGRGPTCTPFFLVAVHPKNGSQTKLKNFVGDPIHWNNNNFNCNEIISTIVHKIHKNGPSISKTYISKMFEMIYKEAVLFTRIQN